MTENQEMTRISARLAGTKLDKNGIVKIKD